MSGFLRERLKGEPLAGLAPIGRSIQFSFVRTSPAAFLVGDGFGERLVIWNGPGTGNEFALRSAQNMR